MKKTQKAQNFFNDGCNCAQAVLAAFSDEIGQDEKTLIGASAAFGGGLAGTHENVCGAVSGMLAAMSMIRGYVDPKDKQAKADFYAVLKPMLEEFKKRNGSLTCREIITRAEGSAQKTRCLNCVSCAAELAEQNISKLRK